MTEYAYDAYGNCTFTYGYGNEFSRINPIRYRGYYLDRETNLYYLNARYYNPEWRRFLSPDDTAYLDPENVNGLNLYAYCNNDPVNYCDPSGHSVTLALITALTCGLIAAGTNAIGQVVFNGATLETIEWERVAIAGVSGFLAGLIPGTGFASLAAQATISSLTEHGLSTLILKDEFNIFDVGRDVVSSLLVGYTIKGLTKVTSKLTSKMFIKGKNYSQFQCYFRRQGFNFSRLEVYSMIERYTFYKEVADEVIKTSLDFFFSFVTYSH